MLTAPLHQEQPRIPEVVYPSIDIPRVTCMTGLQGMGKSTIAKSIAKIGRCTYLSTDAIRLKLGLTFETGSLYPEDQMRLVYENMHYYAQLELEQGRSVVLDGTFGESKRAMFSDLATEEDMCFVHVTVSDEELHRQRMLAREQLAKERGYVVARYQTYLDTRQYYSPPQESLRVRRIYNDYDLGVNTTATHRKQALYTMLNPHFNQADLIWAQGAYNEV